MKQLHTGILCAFEGIDGSGKSTVSRKLAVRLEAEGYEVVLTKEPGATAFGKQIRELVHTSAGILAPEAEFLLFAADRAHHIRTVIKPALEQKKIILCDRMVDSSRAYQGYGRGVSLPMIETISSWVMQGVVPAHTFYLSISYEQAFERIHKRNEALTAYEQEKKDFYVRILNGYDAIYASRTDVTRVNAQENEETVFDEVYYSFKTLLQDYE